MNFNFNKNHIVKELEMTYERLLKKKRNLDRVQLFKKN